MPSDAGRDEGGTPPASAQSMDGAAQAEIEGRVEGRVPASGAAEDPPPPDGLPPAGPHADPALTNEMATPGTGALTPAGAHDDTDSTSG